MGEAWGTVLIKASDPLMEAIRASDRAISWAQMEALFQYAGIPSLKDSHELLSYHEGSDFSHEGIKEAKDFLDITIFGQESMWAMQGLVSKGDKVEVYGSIRDEHNGVDYYALNAAGDSFFECIDEEAMDEEEEEMPDYAGVEKRWKAFIPKALRKHV